MVNSLNSINDVEKVMFNNQFVTPVAPVSNDNVSIFNSNSFNSSDSIDDSAILELEERLDAVEDKQGFITGAWDDLKGALNLGTSSEKCEDTIDKFKNGEISYEEAMAEIEKFDTKQQSSLDLFSNIATGVAAVVAATAAAAAIVASGGTATPLVLAAVGAGTGAVTKVGVKAADRATNEVKKDTLDGKQIAKDALSGGVTGTIGALTMGTGSAGSTLGSSVAKSAASSMKTGAITGSVSGSSNYLIETAFDEDKEFNAKDFVVSTATGAVAGTAVGGIMGSANGAMRYTGVVKHGGSVINKTTGEYVAQNASKEAVTANALCNAEYKLVRKGLDGATSAFAA